MKTRTSLDEEIFDLAEPVAEALGLEIVRVRVMGGKRKTVQIMAERHDGTMHVDDCVRFSRAFGEVLEEADPIAGEYTLEASSPGVDRPLTALEHFARWEGFEAKLELDRMVEGRKRFKGVLAGVEGDNVLIDLEGEDQTAVLPFEWISDAKLVMTDALMEASLKGRADMRAEAEETEDNSTD